MLPFVAPLLFKLQGLKHEHDKQQEQVGEISARMRGNGHGLGDDLRKAQAELQKTATQINELAERINGMGCELKDMEMGLIDFRALVNGREAYLCWKKLWKKTESCQCAMKKRTTTIERVCSKGPT